MGRFRVPHLLQKSFECRVSIGCEAHDTRIRGDVLRKGKFARPASRYSRSVLAVQHQIEIHTAFQFWIDSLKISIEFPGEPLDASDRTRRIGSAAFNDFPPARPVAPVNFQIPTVLLFHRSHELVGCRDDQLDSRVVVPSPVEFQIRDRSGEISRVIEGDHHSHIRVRIA